MRPFLLHLIKLLFYILPETRLFGFKVSLLRAAGISAGDNVRICSSATILGSGSLKIDDDTWIGHQVLICASSRVMIGKAVDIGPRVYIGTGTHEINSNSAHSAGAGMNKDVIIEDGAWLGAGSIILPGITVGEKSVVAAGAVVTEDVPERVLVAGVPARVVREL